MAFPTYYKNFVYFLAISICQSQQLHGAERRNLESRRNAVHLFLSWDRALPSAPCQFGHVRTWGMPPSGTWGEDSLLATHTREIRISGKHWDIFKKFHRSEKLTLRNEDSDLKLSCLEIESLFKKKTVGKDHPKPTYVHVAVSLMLCLMLAISASLQLQNTSSFTSVHTCVLSCPWTSFLHCIWLRIEVCQPMLTCS